MCRKKFGHTQVLDNITLSLSPGSRTAIVGHQAPVKPLCYA